MVRRKGLPGRTRAVLPSSQVGFIPNSRVVLGVDARKALLTFLNVLRDEVESKT